MKNAAPKKIWLSPPHMGGKEQQFINEAFETNWIAPLGPGVNGFEADLVHFLQEDVHVAALSSGTAAIHLALILLGVENGDEVICQSMTFSASANPVVYLGATPVFVDSEPDTWNISPEFLEIAIKDRLAKGKKPKAIIAVHLYGMPAKMNEIMQVAAAYEIPVIEDAAESLGSSYNGKMTGTFGDIACLSFNGNKIITTSGGGALVTKNKILADKARFLATQARDKAPHYEHSQIGYNYRMSNICACIGRGQMHVLNERVKKRREIFNAYEKILKNCPGISFQEELPGVDMYSNRWLTAILIDPELSPQGITNEQLRLNFEADNIEARPLWKPMHLQPVFKSAPYYGNITSNTLFKNGLCLPSGTNMSEEDFGRIVEKILFK
ncbi:MAG TPA: aminotransferase class I/II-fold pyridoxal phosphate-dependent enzyme [Panacibacter sp.]|nr:aminotransferase class I/II-fold pyridoxal phosphate-dependent enzyme [Panacibacter sp.]